MRIVCDSCGTKYSISDEKVRGKLFKIRCKKCSHVIVVRGLETADAQREGLEDERHPLQGDQAGDSAVGDVSAGAEWFYVQDGQQAGPVAYTDLEGYLEAGQITLETYVWREGMDNWVHLSEVPEVVQGFVEPSAAHPSVAGTAPPGGEVGTWGYPEPPAGRPINPFSPSAQPTDQFSPEALLHYTDQSAGMGTDEYGMAEGPSQSDTAPMGGTDYVEDNAITVVARTQVPMSAEDEFARSVYGGETRDGYGDQLRADDLYGGQEQGVLNDGSPFDDESTQQYPGDAELRMRSFAPSSEAVPSLRSAPVGMSMGFGLQPDASGAGTEPGSADGAVATGSSSLVGARHEDSVLFSLDSLSRSTSKLAKREPKERKPSEGSGLIDIRALAARDAGDGSAGAAVPSAEHFVPAVMPLGRRQSNKLLYGLISLGIVIIAGLAAAIVVVLLRQPDQPLATAEQIPAAQATTAGVASNGAVAPVAGSMAVEQPVTTAVAEVQVTAPAGQLQAAAAAATAAAGVSIKAQQTAPLQLEATARQAEALALAQREQARQRDRTNPQTQNQTATERRSTSTATRETSRREEPAATASRGGDAVDDALSRIRNRSPQSEESQPAQEGETPSAETDEETNQTSSDLPERLTTNAVRQTIRRYTRRLSECRQEADIPADEVLRVDVTMTVHATGRVAAATGDSNSAGALCVISVVRDMRFPEFAGEPMDFTYPFRIR